MNLTTYVSRHTMAMTLQGNDVPREIISQALGHRNLTTTNVYLDSFSTSVLDRVAKILYYEYGNKYAFGRLDKQVAQGEARFAHRNGCASM